MKRSERAAQARRHLDARLAQVSTEPLTPPRRGWIRAVRDALGMTSHDLGVRLGITQSAATRLEQSEVDGGMKLATLRRVADALDCDLVYGFVPRTSLEDTVRRRASLLAGRDVALADQMMRLEAQGPDPDARDERVRAHADALVADGRLWSTVP